LNRTVTTLAIGASLAMPATVVIAQSGSDSPGLAKTSAAQTQAGGGQPPDLRSDNRDLRDDRRQWREDHRDSRWVAGDGLANARAAQAGDHDASGP
jgi:hypothetical protein